MEGSSDHGRVSSRQFGHLRIGSLQSLVKGSMVNNLDLDGSQEFGFCEPCTEGKSHRLQILNGFVPSHYHNLDSTGSLLCVH